MIKKPVFVKYKHVTTKKITLKVLSEILFMNFVFFCSLLHAIVPKFANIVVHDSYTVAAILKKML